MKHDKFKTSISAVALASILALSACGGGGGDSSSSSNTPSTPTATPPTISGLADTSIAAGGNTTEQFTVGDAQVSASALTVSATSDNATVLPASGLALSGTTSARSLVITPANGQSGTAHVTVTVSDGTMTATSTIAVTVTPGASNPNALQTTVPTPTYAAGSMQLSMFTEMNNARQAYGVGLVAQNADLDAAAQHHVAYLVDNINSITSTTNLHSEVSTNPGFTGVSPAARVAASGYSARSLDEVAALAAVTSVSGIDLGAAAVDLWLSAPYHRMGVFAPMRDAGVANAAVSIIGGDASPSVIDVGVQNSAQVQLPAPSWVGLWPVPNANNVRYAFAGEAPNPIPENGGQCAGYPVSVQTRYDVPLTVTTFTMVESATDNPVSVKLMTTATDPNNLLPANSAVIIPYAALKLNTTYNVTFTGTVGGVAYSNTWSFTTTGQDGSKLYGCAASS